MNSRSGRAVRRAQHDGVGERRKRLTGAEREAARLAGLLYVSDLDPGFRRRRAGSGFVYLALDGTRIRDPQLLARIRSLAVPPAYEDVWICSSPRGHIQATGRDARKRKQYRYHPLWREERDRNKFAQLEAFGERMPMLRRRLARDLARPGLPREKVLAVVVTLLGQTMRASATWNMHASIGRSGSPRYVTSTSRSCAMAAPSSAIGANTVCCAS